MSTKEILNKLFKIAEDRQKVINQHQKMINKLSQVVNDPNIAYLQKAWQTAALNSGINIVNTPKVAYNAEKTESNEDVVTSIQATYTIHADGIPPKEQIRQKLIHTFQNQLKAQRPDLEGKVSVLFN